VPGFRLVHEWQPFYGAMRLWLYHRAGPPAGTRGTACGATEAATGSPVPGGPPAGTRHGPPGWPAKAPREQATNERGMRL